MEYTYKPVQFFAVTFAITWISWFIAAYFSYQEDAQLLLILFMIPGLLAPLGTSLWMIFSSKNSNLKKNFINKLYNVQLIKRSSLPALLFIAPAMVVLSIFLSLFFGESIDQLQLATSFSFSVAFVPVFLVLTLAAVFEELGWRSYAVDSLWSRYNYFTTTFIFSVLWSLWHLPLFFINNYYQRELLTAHPLFAINFIVGVIPMGFIISWLCRMNNGSILTAILFHFFINISQEAFQISQFTKCIETVVLTLITIIVVAFNKKMFFDKKVLVT